MRAFYEYPLPLRLLAVSAVAATALEGAAACMNADGTNATTVATYAVPAQGLVTKNQPLEGGGAMVEVVDCIDDGSGVTKIGTQAQLEQAARHAGGLRLVANGSGQTAEGTQVGCIVQFIATPTEALSLGQGHYVAVPQRVAAPSSAN